MPLVTLYRDGEIAYVETDYKDTYENFLAHGWAHEVDKAEDAETDAEPTPKKPTARPGRKTQ